MAFRCDHTVTPLRSRMKCSWLLLCIWLPVRGDAQPRQIQPITWLVRDSSAIDAWPYIAPDGKTVTFSRSTDGRKTWQLLRTSATGDPVRPFFDHAPAPNITRASWSRRHDRLAFTATAVGDTSSLWTSDRTGGSAKRVPGQYSPGTMYPSWTPSGDALVAVDYTAPGGAVLVQITLTTGATSRLTHPEAFGVGMPSVSPDGEFIAFAGQRNTTPDYDESKNHIWLLDRSGEPREISQGLGRQPDWSPDGQWLAFTSSRGDSAGRHAIFIVSRAGGEPIQLTEHDIHAQHPVWSPDGSWLVFSALIRAQPPAFGVARIPSPRPRK